MNKSIVTFTRGTLAQATPLWQYDYGQVLEINGLELPTTYQVHFCNCSDTQTITVLGNADGVLIPANLLQTGKTVIAYIYLHTGADDGETEYKITIPVRPRPAPSDIPPTPEQQSALDEAIAALNSAVDDVEDIADGIPDQINDALEEAKASGEFDGEDGYSPTVTVNEIEGGHRVTITDESGDHVFDVLDGQGGGGTGDYDDLTDKPSVNGVTLSGNKTAADLGLAPAGAYVKPSDGIPAIDLDADVQDLLGLAGTALQEVPSDYRTAAAQDAIDAAQDLDIAARYFKPPAGIPKTDLASAVRTSLGKADTALQSYTETDPTVPSWAKQSSKPSYTAAEIGAIAAPASPATGAFLVWNGTAWTAQTLATWQGGNY